VGVRRNLVANLVGQGWSAALNLATVPIYLALLGVESFGLIGFASVVLVLASLLDGGVAVTINRAMVQYRAGEADLATSADQLRSFELALFAAALLVGGLAMLLAPPLADRWLDARGLPLRTVEISLVLMVQIALLRMIEAIYRAALLGLERPVTMNVLSVAFTSMRILGPVPFVLWSGGDVLTFFEVQLVASLASVAAFAVVTHLALEGSVIGNGRFRRAELRNALGFAGGAFAISVLLSLANQLDKLVVARLAPLEMLGYYSAASVVATGIYQLVLPVFHSFYPRLTFLHSTDDRLQFERLFLRAAATVGFVAGVPIGIIALNADAVLFAWTGDIDVMQEAGPLLPWLCLGALAAGLFYALFAALLACARHGVAVITTAALLVALVPVMLAGWNRGGLVGLAAGWGIAMATWYVATLLLTAWRVTGVRVGLGALGISLAPAAVALLASLIGGNLIEVPVVEQWQTGALVVGMALAVTLTTAGALWLCGRTMILLRKAPA
jgi:O-antigen/teichoic acid export membrane protein